MEFEPPVFGEATPPCHPSEDTLRLLSQRRSTAADLMGAPGPTPLELRQLLQLAARAPDHRCVAPYRFIIFEGEGRANFGGILADAYKINDPQATPERIEKERARFMRAPVVVGVVSSVRLSHRTPEWEQILTAGAVCQNLLIAANAFGFAAQWLTEWYAFDPAVLAHLNLSDDDEIRERIAGFVYLGSANEPPKERARPDVENITSTYK